VAFHSKLNYTPKAYKIQRMEFIETSVFTRLLADLLSDEEYRALQNAPMENPEAGAVLKDGGGIRKLRYAQAGQGKSGGVRVIYYCVRDKSQIYMLLIYPKSRKDDLTDKETALLREFVKEL
jgi:hypothetical protein